ncbi:contractile injection system protein, VgrG/Pvc8 family [Paenibacillus dendritiformis]|uniref:contractile injection system protein, VgrG/Pvc8 family n=1 Tax=Paenibacillus dendritiformis TaxID=130049 RepID=UPI00248B8487|nr:contractile injection system protein, VgrG/Pvc8 family [Paenibacillus dendritiformis]WGU92301.1 contractile injection system protein, VgrG/Pvc8 family [Paenibacillus dendritiformis]
MSVLHSGIGYESLRFYGSFQPQHIEKLQITRTINDHAYLTVSGMLSEEQGSTCIGQNMDEEPIVIRQLDEQGQSRRRLFHGIVTRLSVHCIRGVYTFELEAASHSYQMDIQIMKRSYQDIHRTYADLVTTMIRKYKYGDAIDTVTNNAKLGTFVLQYEETDWAFLQRLASRFGSVLVPEVTAASPKVFFGIPEGKMYKMERDVSCQVRRTFHELEAGKPGKRAGSVVTYVIESLQYYALGDIIALPIGSGKELVVVRAVTRLEDGLLLTRYDLQAEQDIRLARYENDKATGIALTGSVLKVHQDLVQLQLDIDPKQDPAKACWFPMATRYAAEEHGGWYDMPEVGERVELYLPTSREQEAYVMDSRQHRHAQGEPDVKVWRHAQGSGVDMSEQELTLSTSGALSITLGNGITVSSPGDVRIQGGHVKLDAGQELSLTAGSAMYLTGGASSMVLDGETDIKAPVVDQEGSVKAPVFVMDLPPVPEPPLMNVKDYEAAQAAAREGSTDNKAKTPTAKLTSPADQKQADGLLDAESKLLGSIPVIGAVAGAVAGAALGGLAGAAVSVGLLASAAVPVRSTGTSRAGGAQGGLHPLKYLAGLVMQGLISQYEHEKAKDAYYRKWLLGKVFTSARELGTPTSWNDIASYVRRMAQSANELEQAYHQIPSEVRQRWKANYERYMAEQPKPKPEQEPSKSWLAILGEAQLMEAEARLAMGQQMADGVMYTADVGGEVVKGASTAVLEDLTLGFPPLKREYTSNHPKARKTGEVIGHLITTVGGLLEMAGAVLGGGAGVTLSGTGVFSPVGVAVTAESVALAGHGAGVTYQGLSNTGETLNELYQMFKSGGSNSPTPKKSPSQPSGTGNPSPEQLLKIKHANIGNPRASLNEKVPLDIRLRDKNLKGRHLTKEEKQLANQHLNDLVARKNGDQSAAQRLSQDKYRMHLRDDGWISLDLMDKNGASNIMRLLFRETKGGIEWKVIQNH